MPLTTPPTTPPALHKPAPPTAAETQGRMLEAYDWGRPLPAAPRGKEHPSLRWLRESATFDPMAAPPSDPFPPGSARREAESLRALMKAPGSQLASRLGSLRLDQAGTALALWRWGKAQVRQGLFPRSIRKAWEDRLLAQGPGLTRGYALRHALCWALAEQDEARFAELKARSDETAGPVLAQFQRLFGLLGGPSPVLRLWSLPGQAYEDLRLDQLGARRLWILPAAEGPLPDLPADVAWIIPSLDAGTDERSASLPAGLVAEARSLSTRLQAGGRTAWYLPSRAAFEDLGLAWFPILLELDGQGNFRAIRMGDAAPRTP